MEISTKELREALYRAQTEATDELEHKVMGTGETESEPELDWEKLYLEGRDRKTQAATKKRKGLRAAIVFFAVFLAGVTSVFSVEASRKVVLQWFARQGQKQDDFHFEQTVEPKEKEPPKTIEKIYAPTYIPEGFELVDEMVDDLGVYDEYQKNKNYIQFSQEVSEAHVAIDSEDMNREEVTVQGYQGQLNSKKGKTILIWATGEYVFTLSSDLDKEEVVKIAESIREKERD